MFPRRSTIIPSASACTRCCEGPDGRVYLKTADEFDHHSIVLRRADSAGVDMMCFKVFEDADLDRFEKRVAEYGFKVDHVKAGEMPGVRPSHRVDDRFGPPH